MSHSRDKGHSQSTLTPQSVHDKFGIKLADVPDDEIELCVGLSLDGVVIKTAHVKAMSGQDRSRATSGKRQRSPAHMTTSLLTDCVVDLGGRKPTAQDFRKMTEPDRTYLALEIRRKTYPNEKLTITAECDKNDGGCGEKYDFHVDLDEIEIRRVSPIWRDDQPCFEIHDADSNIHVTMHYLLGQDMEDLSRDFKGRQNDVGPAELMDYTVMKMIMDFNGQEITEDEYAACGAFVHSTIEQGLIEHRAGPDTEPFAECENCGKQMSPSVNIMDFILRGRQKKESSN